MQNNVAVTPGEVLTVECGPSGGGGSGPQHPTAPGQDGGDSKVSRGGTVLCHASGGKWQNSNRCDAGNVVVGDGGGMGGSDYTASGGAGGNGNQMIDLDGTGNYSGGGGDMELVVEEVEFHILEVVRGNLVLQLLVIMVEEHMM